MRPIPRFALPWFITVALMAICATVCSAAAAPASGLPTSLARPATEMAGELLKRYTDKSQHLTAGHLNRSFSITSEARDGAARGEALAEIHVSLSVLRAVLTQPERWCEILLLTPHVAGCASMEGGSDARFEVKLLYRYDQPADEAKRAQFRFEQRLSQPEFLSVRLASPQGPLGTQDYRLELEAAALDEQRSVLKVEYSYRYGIRAAAALGFYLATTGRQKQGFTLGEEGEPVRGLRGSVERNAMRYFLAIESHALCAEKDAAMRFQVSLDQWLRALEPYPGQIAEADPDDYRRIKLEQFGSLP